MSQKELLRERISATLFCIFCAITWRILRGAVKHQAQTILYHFHVRLCACVCFVLIQVPSQIDTELTPTDNNVIILYGNKKCHLSKFISFHTQNVVAAGNRGKHSENYSCLTKVPKDLTGVQCEKGLVHRGWQCLTVAGFFCGKHPPGENNRFLFLFLYPVITKLMYCHT